MKHGYEGADSGVLINNYKSNENKIVITFLDGNTYEIPFTKENEKELLNIMLGQAKEREKSNAMNDALKKRKHLLISLAIVASSTIASSYFFSTVKHSLLETIAFLIGGVCGITLISNTIVWHFSNKEIQELDKYSLYLSIMDELEVNQDPNILNGVRKKEDDTLNINTIDNYSLKEMKKIKANLGRSSQYSYLLNR